MIEMTRRAFLHPQRNRAGFMAWPPRVTYPAKATRLLCVGIAAAIITVCIAASRVPVMQ